jgi:hypothetical protein
VFFRGFIKMSLNDICYLLLFQLVFKWSSLNIFSVVTSALYSVCGVKLSSIHTPACGKGVELHLRLCGAWDVTPLNLHLAGHISSFSMDLRRARVEHTFYFSKPATGGSLSFSLILCLWSFADPRLLVLHSYNQ